MSNAVANVREDEVLVELRIMLEDLVLFHSLKADAQTLFKAEDLRKAAVSHDSFLLKHSPCVTATVKCLKARCSAVIYRPSRMKAYRRPNS